MTDAELDAIQARADAATAGPWYAVDYSAVGVPGSVPWAVDCNMPDSLSVAMLGHGYGEEGEPEGNAQFIAHARADVPALVAEVRLLRQVISDQQQESGLFDAGFRAGIEAAAEDTKKHWNVGYVAKSIRDLRPTNKTE